MRRRNPLRPLLVAMLVGLAVLALVDRASAQTVVTEPLPDLGASQDSAPLARRAPMEITVAIGTGAPALTPEQQARRARVRADLASARRRHLGMLRRYARAMEFPMNTYQPGMLNVFIDEQGHICAAANLIARDGQRELVDATAAQQNFLRLADVREGPLLDWMLRSGFTQEEIARIQEPYFNIDDQLPPRDYAREREDEKRRVRGVLLSVARELERDTDASLELATDRLVAVLDATAANTTS